MNSIKVNRLLEEIASWSKEERVLLIEKLKGEISDDVHQSPHNPKDKLALLDSVCGAWADTSEDLVNEILESRTISDKDLSLD